MINTLQVLIIFSSLSFTFYGIAYFASSKMKIEFIRFGLEKLGAVIAVLELLGAAGLLIGLKFLPILLISAGGLTLLMISGVVVRIKVKDPFWAAFPAIFFMFLNAYIFLISLPV